MVDVRSWLRLARSLEYYEGLGYRYLDVPWIIDRMITQITCSDVSRIFAVPGQGDLVGSAEQSFLALELLEKLPRGRFVACSPCFRNEPVLDDLHQAYFMKVELYQNNPVSLTALEAMIEVAQAFFEQQASPGLRVDRVVTPEGFDLAIRGIEVGSYGIRTLANGVTWVYGTGLAEPRFSKAIIA